SDLMSACDNDAALFERVLPFAGLLRTDTFGKPVVIAAGSVYVTQGSDRRSTGTHYTPRSLTEPIVQHALDPLVYLGPAEGKPQEEWQLRPAGDILKLKVCDFAMGSGAFLVQVCRYLAEKLVEAWETALPPASGQPGQPTMPPRITPEGLPSSGDPGETLLPADETERLALAMRLVAERCIYGVDKNSLAVEMAKLSLWLITLSKNKPFTFLDHALRRGDSLLGVNLRQLTSWSMDASPASGAARQMVWIEPALKRALEVTLKWRRQISTMPENTVRDIENKAGLLFQVEGAMAILKLGADLLIATTLEQDPKRRSMLQDTLHMDYTLLLSSYENSRTIRYTTAIWTMDDDAYNKLRDEVDNLLNGRRPFHWPLEFPEVFAGLEEERGFSAIISNPPFQGGQKITSALGTNYRDYLVEYLANGKRGSADLCAYFFLQASRLVREGGMCGLLATNTIAQGDTREVGLDQIIAAGWSIPYAVPSRKWPGEASLEVAHIWLRHGNWHGAFILNDLPVEGISTFLTPQESVQGKPYRLFANADKSFIGSYVLGMGFVLEPQEALALIEKDPRNRIVLYPYLNGEDLNSRPDQSPSRWVINFHDWPLEQAEMHPDCMKIVREKIKPERDLNNRKVRREQWWLFAERASGLYSTIAGKERVLVIALTSRTCAFSFNPSDIVFSHATGVFALDKFCHFAILQSAFHVEWAFYYASSMKGDLRYTPSDCFETYPFPLSLQGLDDIGERCFQHRQAIMLERQEGLTKTYNRFHNPKVQAEEIIKLRVLHREMDEAVVRAYGWDDLTLGHGFHETKLGVRYTISEEARSEVLGRLLRLNHERYAKEVVLGLHEKGAKKGKGKNSKGKRGTEIEGVQGELVFE
ncbi:MAG TPA: DNA methyltransferase, partial [Ktedonobacteraceae bacterium]|nr:DNA methyltransferase [Ktedonobacteraceae bacterium]